MLLNNGLLPANNTGCISTEPSSHGSATTYPCDSTWYVDSYQQGGSGGLALYRCFCSSDSSGCEGAFLCPVRRAARARLTQTHSGSRLCQISSSKPDGQDDDHGGAFERHRGVNSALEFSGGLGDSVDVDVAAPDNGVGDPDSLRLQHFYNRWCSHYRVHCCTYRSRVFNCVVNRFYRIFVAGCRDVQQRRKEVFRSVLLGGRKSKADAMICTVMPIYLGCWALVAGLALRL